MSQEHSEHPSPPAHTIVLPFRVASAGGFICSTHLLATKRTEYRQSSNGTNCDHIMQHFAVFKYIVKPWKENEIDTFV